MVRTRHVLRICNSKDVGYNVEYGLKILLPKIDEVGPVHSNSEFEDFLRLDHQLMCWFSEKDITDPTSVTSEVTKATVIVLIGVSEIVRLNPNLTFY